MNRQAQSTLWQTTLPTLPRTKMFMMSTTKMKNHFPNSSSTRLWQTYQFLLKPQSTWVRITSLLNSCSVQRSRGRRSKDYSSTRNKFLVGQQTGKNWSKFQNSNKRMKGSTLRVSMEFASLRDLIPTLCSTTTNFLSEEAVPDGTNTPTVPLNDHLFIIWWCLKAYEYHISDSC